MSEPAESCELAIIGGGAAGLCAAQRLCASGMSVALIEARDRLGGRIHTLYDPLFPLPVELGAEFIHSRDSAIWPILQASGTSAYLADADHWHLKNGRLERDNGFWDEVGRVLDKLKALGERDMSFRQFVEQSDADAPARENALAFIEGFDAAPADRISAESIAQAEAGSDETEGSESFRIVDGYGKVIDHLRQVPTPQTLTLHLRTVVKAVRWKRDEVEVEVQSPQGDARPTIRAKKCVVTLPIGVLRSEAVKFIPDIAEKRAAWKQIEMGQVVKAIFKFRDAFWESRQIATTPSNARLTHMAFMHARETAFPTWWSYFPVYGSVLTAWAGGPAAQRLARQPHDKIFNAALTSLSQFTGIAARELEELVEAFRIADWQADPYSLGAYSYITVGGIDAPKKLAEPIDGTLYFAGEGTATEGLGGTVDAALTTGKRAAEQALIKRKT